MMIILGDDHDDEEEEVVMMMMMMVKITNLGWPMNRRGGTDQMSVKLGHLEEYGDDDDNDDD